MCKKQMKVATNGVNYLAVTRDPNLQKIPKIPLFNNRTFGYNDFMLCILYRTSKFKCAMVAIYCC